ncbi:CFA58 protein, partial [Polypterus senegalus]
MGLGCVSANRDPKLSRQVEKAEKSAADENAYDVLEREFQEVLNELVGDKNLEKFRAEYEKLHKALKKSHESEKRLMAKCRELNAEIVSNSAKVATAMKLSQEDQTTIASLKKEIEKAWKMVDSAHEKEQKSKDTIQTLKQEIANLSKQIEQGTGLSIGQEHSVNDLLKIKEDLTKERDELLSEVVSLRENLTKSAVQQQQIEAQKDEANETIAQLQQDIQMRQNECARETRRKEKLEKEMKQLQVELDAKHAEIKGLNQHNQRSKDDLAKLEQQLREQKILNERATKDYEQLQVRNAKIAQENDQNVLTVEQLTQENQQRSLELKSEIKAVSATQKQINLVKLHEQAKKNLDQEIQNYKDEAQKQRKIIYQLEKERDRYINEASELTQKVLQHMEDIKVREIQIFDYKKKIAEVETKLKQQQNLYEAVRSDRNLYSKNLIEAQDEITEMKRKLKIMNHQIDQLKEEINGKEAALMKELSEHQRVEKEKEALKAELQKMKLQAQETKQYIDNQEAEERKLLKIISDADAERLKQRKELEQVIGERDILGTQLVRRNDELALLYEKIKIQQSLLNKGEIQYNQRVEDLRLLKLEIKKLRREKGILTKTVANVEDLRREVYHMQKELLKERTRCRALEEELENPMNVHRWRKLEASDPSTFELIQKIHTLQKRLISKTEEVVEKELLLQEKEKLYIELKHILARQPGPEAAEQLQIYQQTLREKTKQLKALSSELNMYESQTEDYKYEIERLALELQNVKKKYLTQKRKEQQERGTQKKGDKMSSSVTSGRKSKALNSRSPESKPSSARSKWSKEELRKMELQRQQKTEREAFSALHQQIYKMKLMEETQKNLERDIQKYKDEDQKQKKVINQLEKDRNRFMSSADELTKKVLQQTQEAAVWEKRVAEYIQKLAEKERKFREQQSMYESARSEGNFYHKSLITAQHEITEMKQKMNMMNDRIEGLNEEIDGKQAALLKQRSEYLHLEKEKDAITEELQRMKKQAKETKSYIEHKEDEERKLLKIIKEADAERILRLKELQMVKNERDILGTQLIRRNDEVSLLYEKIKIQQVVLNKGITQYNQRLEDIRLLKVEIKNQKQEKLSLINKVGVVNRLRQELFQTRADLWREQTKCLAMEEKVENPVNLHRWRKLEANDPSTYELIQKVIYLEKRLIRKTEEVAEKELLLQALVAELNMHASQTDDYKREIEKLDKELQTVKKKYITQKRKEQRSK